MSASGLVRQMVEQHKQDMQRMLAEYAEVMDESVAIYEQAISEYRQTLIEAIDELVSDKEPSGPPEVPVWPPG